MSSLPLPGCCDRYEAGNGRVGSSLSPSSLDFQSDNLPCWRERPGSANSRRTAVSELVGSSTASAPTSQRRWHSQADS
jgi:hypothetical protein